MINNAPLRQSLWLLGYISLGVVVGLVVGFSAVALIVLGIGHELSERSGMKLIAVLTIAGAYVGLSSGPHVKWHELLASLRTYLNTRSMIDRACMAWAVVWTAAIAVLVPAFGPFWRNSRYWYLERDGIATALWWLLPIIGGFVVSRLVAWVMRGSR